MIGSRWLWIGGGLALACTSPQPPAARSESAALYAAQGRLVEAVREVEVAVRMHPRNVELRKQAATLRVQSGAFDRAAMHLQSASRFSPRDVSVWMALCEVERLRQNFDGAYVACRRARILAPDDPAVLAAFARAAAEAGIRDEAREARSELEGITPGPASLAVE